MTYGGILHAVETKRTCDFDQIGLPKAQNIYIARVKFAL